MKKSPLFLLLCIFLLSTVDGQNISVTKTCNTMYVSNPQNWITFGAEQVALDDNFYAYTKAKLPMSQTGAITFMNFGFSIPSDAEIVSITAKLKRFKNGKHTFQDLSASFLKRYGSNSYGAYGLLLAKTEYWTDAEAEILYTHDGSGNYVNSLPEEYQWTPAMINDYYFGFDLNARQIKLRGAGKLEVAAYLDKLEITIEYTQPGVKVAKNTIENEAGIFFNVVAFPNPFTTQTTIRFTPNENVNTVVDLFNIQGSKIKTLFNGMVNAGQEYNVTVNEATLPKGIYFFIISDGKKRTKGQLIKIE